MMSRSASRGSRFLSNIRTSWRAVTIEGSAAGLSLARGFEGAARLLEFTETG
jgi:hypothetical protein